ncbi:MAG: ion transporter [Bacteroidia bacterium]|nr:ion transporter [Bacteroidia bacterium]
MNANQYKAIPGYQQLVINDRVVMSAIILNIIILFLLSFDGVNHHLYFLEYLDTFLTLFFLIEMIVKLRYLGWQAYIASGWNKMDFIIVVLTTPSLFLIFFDLPNFSLLLILRALRVAKFFRFLKFVPHLNEILDGVGRALKASVFVLIAFFLYNIIISLFSCYLFREIAPEHFGNALISCYSTFKMFTLEGWYEIPETISHQAPLHMEFFTKFYFIFIVVTGGVFGLSIVNAIFVDEMVSDNNNELENRISHLENKIDLLIDKLDELSQQKSSNTKPGINLAYRASS